MFPYCKITEISFMRDEFSKNFDEIIYKNAGISHTQKKRDYHRDGKMSDS